MLLRLLCISLCYTVGSTVGRFLDELPHCSRSTVMEGEVREYDDFKGKMNIFSAVQLQMTLHETACISLKMNSTSDVSFLHTLEFLRLEQHHPVTAFYRFGIPRVTSSCICDCYGGDEHCTISDYHYKNCTSGALCYRTYHPFQTNVGCLGNGKSEACCQIRIDPYKEWVFNAIKINQPDTILVFRYRIFERINKKWRLSIENGVFNDDIIKVPMNKGSERFELSSRHQLEIVVSGSRPNREVTPGMYFVREGTDELRGGVSINGPGETSLDKLGWLRIEDGKWDVKKGLVKVTQSHHVNVADCKRQQYTSTFNGEQLVTVSGDDEFVNIDLGRPLTDDPWINTAIVSDRVVRVEHAEGANVMVSMTTVTRPHVLRHASQFTSFDGLIQLDKDSNRYLNITFKESKGTMIGQVFADEITTKADVVFSIQTDVSSVRDFRTIISIPSSINGRRFVCFHPSGDPEGKRCKWFEYDAQRLSRYGIAHRWQNAIGECPGCNERGMESLLVSMDPRSWLDGINSTTELLTVIVEVVIAIVLILLIIVTCSKCIIPLLRCTVAIMKPPKKR